MDLQGRLSSTHQALKETEILRSSAIGIARAAFDFQEWSSLITAVEQIIAAEALLHDLKYDARSLSESIESGALEVVL